MAPIVVPVEYNVNPASTQDVLVLEEEKLPDWKEYYKSKIGNLRFRGQKRRRTSQDTKQ